jgi:hypothetical protein
VPRDGKAHVKLTLTFSAALLACATTAQGQGASVGVKAGLNVAGLTFSSKNDSANPKDLTGLVAGIFAIMPINAVVAFQPEVLLCRQGAEFTSAAGGGVARIQVDYVQVPLLGRFRLEPGSPIAVLVGPSLGFSSRGKFIQAGQPDQELTQLGRLDVELVTGVALDVGHAVVDGRYGWGLRNVTPNGASSVSSEAKNRVASITLGFRF